MMSTQLDNLYRVQKKDAHRAAVMLADAFQHDPAWNAVFADATVAQRAYAFEAPVRYCMKYGEVHAPSEALEGVAAWVPGELADMTLWRILRCGALWSGMKVGTDIAVRMRPVFRPIELDRKAYITGKPYIYLQIIGVATAFQGQGFGGKLLRALIEKSEQTGVSLYLETETEANVNMYEHFGFTVIKKIVLPIIDLPMWEMTRGV
jgi:ribosomal protein S18 acetylase RimI-like enzyme